MGVNFEQDKSISLPEEHFPVSIQKLTEQSPEELEAAIDQMTEAERQDVINRTVEQIHEEAADLKDFERKGLFGFLASDSVKRIVGSILLFSFGAAISGKAADYFEKANKVKDKAAAESHNIGGTGVDGAGWTSRTETVRHVLNISETASGSGDYTHAKHFKTGETAPSDGDAVKHTMNTAQAKLAKRIADARAQGYELEGTAQNTLVKGHASHEFDNKIDSKAARDLNDNLAKHRGEDAVKELANNSANGRIEVGAADHDMVRVPTADGVKEIKFAEYLDSHGLTQAQFNQLAQKINAGKQVPDEFKEIGEVLKINRGISVESTAHAKLVKTEVKEVKIPNTPPIPPDDGGSVQSPDLIKLGPQYARVREPEPEYQDVEKDRITEDPPPPIIVEPPIPPPLPPIWDPIRKVKKGSPEGFVYSKYSGKEVGNVRTTHNVAGTHRGGVGQVGEGMTIKNEFSATPRKQSQAELYLNSLSSGQLARLRHEFDRTQVSRGLNHKAREAAWKKFVKQKIDRENG